MPPPRPASRPRGPVVLITGASQGIGAALARTFAREVPGVRLALVARSAGRLATVAAACRRLGAAAAEGFPADVTDAAAVEALAATVARRFGPVEVLVNNAGVFRAAPFLGTSVAEFDALIAANLRSAFLVSRAFVPAMLRRRRGDVFFLSSIAGLGPYPGGTAYGAAKAGVTSLARVLRAETRGRGLRVCCVHPGATWTPSWAGSGVPPARMMPAEDIARAIVDAHRLSRRTVLEELILRPAGGDL